MSKVKGRRKPLHSEITSLRRSKKATVVEVPAPEVAATDSASADEASPESEVSAETSPESIAEAAPSDAVEVEAEAAVEAEGEAAMDPGPDAAVELEPEPETAIHSPREQHPDGLRAESAERLAPLQTEETASDIALADAFDAGDERRTPSNVVSIDGDEPDDMEMFLCGLIEALLFTSQKPLPLKDLARSAGIDRPRARELVERLMRSYAPRGINIEEVAGGYVLRSSARYAPQIQKFLSLRPVRLSRAQLETLAIVAYRQPVTKPEVDDIRGVDSGQVLKGLLDRDLLKTLGKKDEPGRPMLYGTTNDFLELLNLRSLGELPTLREYTELSDESKRKFAEETGEEAPNELPLAETAAESAGDAANAVSAEATPSSEGANPSEGSLTAHAPAADVTSSAEPEATASASDEEVLEVNGETEDALDRESEDAEAGRAHGDVEAAAEDEDEDNPDDDEDEDADEEDDEDDFDEDDDFDDDDEDEEDEDADEEDDEDE